MDPATKLVVPCSPPKHQISRDSFEFSFDDIFHSPINHGSKNEMSQISLESTDQKQNALPRPPPPETKEETEFCHSPGLQPDDPLLPPTELSITENSKVSLGDFDLLCTVGVGAFGRVLQVRNKTTGLIYAMKVMRKNTVISKKAVDYIRTEHLVMKTNSHPFIVDLHCAFQSNGKLYLVMDFAYGGPLWNHLRREAMLPESHVQFYIAEIALALIHLHERGIVHRDLKPENILMDHEGHVSVTDFGLAKQNVSGTEGAQSFCGTDDYIAPEIIKGNNYGKAVDWWSLGALMYDMLAGEPPFKANNRNNLYKKICSAKIKYPTYLTGPAVSLLKGLLNRDPEKRLECGLNIKKHTFFKGMNWKGLLSRVIIPPITPGMKHGSLDVSNFSPQFTNLPVADSPAGCAENSFFNGFTFVRSPQTFFNPSTNEESSDVESSDCTASDSGASSVV